jgi:hypothetical protein
MGSTEPMQERAAVTAEPAGETLNGDAPDARQSQTEKALICVKRDEYFSFGLN